MNTPLTSFVAATVALSLSACSADGDPPPDIGIDDTAARAACAAFQDVDNATTVDGSGDTIPLLSADTLYVIQLDENGFATVHLDIDEAHHDWRIFTGDVFVTANDGPPLGDAFRAGHCPDADILDHFVHQHREMHYPLTLDGAPGGTVPFYADKIDSDHGDTDAGEGHGHADADGGTGHDHPDADGGTGHDHSNADAGTGLAHDGNDGHGHGV